MVTQNQPFVKHDPARSGEPVGHADGSPVFTDTLGSIVSWSGGLPPDSAVSPAGAGLLGLQSGGCRSGVLKD